MHRTTLEEFRETILATGGYETPVANCPPRRARKGALTTLRLSWAVVEPFRLCGIYEGLGRLTFDRWAHMCFDSLRTAEALGIRLHFEGWKNRQAHDGPVMYLCNHMSTLETIFLPPVLLGYGPFSFVAKASLAHLPFLERASAHMGMVPIGRTSPREDLMNMLRIGGERIASGQSFLIFPQGTRQAVFSRAKYSSIGAKLAEKAGCPICPIVVDTRCLPTRTGGLLGKVFKDFGPVDPTRDVRCACGPIIPCGKARDMHEAAFDWMAAKLDSWGLPTARERT